MSKYLHSIFSIVPYLLLSSILMPACKQVSPFITATSFITSVNQTTYSTQTPSLTPTELPTTTEAPTPTSTHQPTQTFTPTVSPTPTITPLPQPAQVIGVENASQVIELAAWGKGSLYLSEIAANGEVIVASTSLGIYLYQADSMKIIRHLDQAVGTKGWGGFIFSPDKQALLCNFTDGTSHMIRLVDGEDISSFSAIGKISLNIREWLYTLPSIEYDKNYKKYFFEANRISSAAFSPDGISIAIAYASRTIGIWKIADSKLMHELKHDTVGVSNSLIFSPDGKILLSGINGDLAAWDVENGELLWKLRSVGHFNGQPFSVDGTLFVSEVTHFTSLDSWVNVFTSRYGDEIGRVTGRVSSHAISPDNKLLITTSYDEIKVWSLPALIQQQKISTGLDWPRASFSDNGQYILVNEGEQAWRLSDYLLDKEYQAPTPTEVIEISSEEWGRLGHFNPQGMRIISPDHVITWGSDNETSLWWWDVFSLTYHLINLPEKRINGNVDLSQDGSYFATCTESGLTIVPLNGSEPLVYSRCRTPGLVTVSGDSSLIFRSSGNTIDAIDSTTGDLKFSFIGHSLNITGLESSGKNYLVSASSTGAGGFELFLWQIDPPTKLGNWLIPENWTRLGNVALSNDNNLLLANLSNQLRLFRLSDDFQRKIFDFGSDGVAFSPDDQIALLGTSIWQVSDWSQLTSFGENLTDLIDITFMEDGKSWLTLSDDGIVRQWGIP